MPSPDAETRRRAEMLASRADHPSVTADRLAGTADGVTDLESPVVAHLVDGEEPAFCFESHDRGIGIGDPGATVEPERGGVFLFTDVRVYLQLGLPDGDRALSLSYASITDAEFHPGMRRHRIELAYEGTSYHLWVPTSFDRDSVAQAVEYATYRHKQATPDRGRGGWSANDAQSVRERLERLGEAKSRGIIDDEEYQHRKEKLLRLDEE